MKQMAVLGKPMGQEVMDGLSAQDDLLKKLRTSVLQPQGNEFYNILSEFASESFTSRASDETTSLTDARNAVWWNTEAEKSAKPCPDS